MPLTRNFKDTIKQRAETDPEFRLALLQEALESFLAGDTEEGKIILRDYINATIGFGELSSITNKNPKSLMRMLSPSGNPRAENLFEIIGHLQKQEGVSFEIRTSQ